MAERAIAPAQKTNNPRSESLPPLPSSQRPKTEPENRTYLPGRLCYAEICKSFKREVFQIQPFKYSHRFDGEKQAAWPQLTLKITTPF